VCALAHLGLVILAVANGFIIFRGPSTPTEVFWDGAMRVLLFPADQLFGIIRNGPFQVLLTGLNSLLWGAVAAFGVQMLGKSAGIR
jgi:hypothetical protein